jgi:hypothetical protein
MPTLPTLQKTWSYDVNQGPYTGASDSGDTGLGWIDHFWGIKDSFKNQLSPGWSIAGSGGLGVDGLGGMDGVDRWVVPGNIRWAGSNGPSWIVFQNNNIRTGFQVLFGTRDGGGGWPDGCTWRVSPGGNYTGGSKTVKPTATDEIILSDTVWWAGNDGQADSRVHTMMSSDGECTRMVICEGNVPRWFGLFDKPRNPVSGWTDPWVILLVQFNNANNIPTYAQICDVSTYCWSSVGSSTMKLYCTSEGWRGNMAGENMTWGNDLDGNTFPMAGMGLASETSGLRGRHGELFDIWWGSTIQASGYHYPDTLPRQFVQIRNIILPWDQTANGMQMV